MTRIAHFVPHTGKAASGYSYAVPRLCRALADAHHVVQLISMKERITDIGLPSEQVYRSGGVVEVTRQIVQLAPLTDLLHAHSLWRLTNVLPAWVAQHSAKPYVVSPRGTLSPAALRHSRVMKQLFSMLGQRRTLQRAALLHATSEGEYEDIRRLGLTQPVAIIPNGVDIPELVEDDFASENRILLYVGRIHPIKGLELLLQCWRVLAPKNLKWVLRVVGPIDSQYAKNLKSAARTEHIPRVEFVGELAGNALLKEYQRAEALVLPSISENFGMVVAESLANGIPVVATKGTPWVGLRERHCGWWVDRTAEDLYAALDELLSSNTVKLREMGLHGRKWMIESFSWEQVASDMSAAYSWLLGGGERPWFIRT